MLVESRPVLRATFDLFAVLCAVLRLSSKPIAEGFAYALEFSQLQVLKAIAVAHGLCKDNGYPFAIRSSLGDTFNGGTKDYAKNAASLDIDNELPTYLFAGFI